MDKLTAGLEDYLEVICNLSKEKTNIKAVEIAKKMNISRAAVCESLIKLAEKKLIIYEGHKGVTITEEGMKKALDVINRHNIFSSFFENVLGLERKIAEKNACKMEHIVCSEVFERMKLFHKYCLKENIIDSFRKSYKK